MKTHQTLAVTAMILGGALPVFAQTVAAPPVAPAAAAPSVRFQVRTMETVLASAIQSGVDQIAQKINEAIPGLPIFAGAPHAHGYQVESYGWFFDVEVPEVRSATIDLYVELQRAPGARAAANNRPVSSTSGVAAAQDPMQSPVIQDPQREYRLAIREALIDAMLDYGQLPLKPTEWLTVGARAADPPVPTMPGSDTVTLVLSIRGEDLALLRQEKLTRAEAKARIKIREERR